MPELSESISEAQQLELDCATRHVMDSYKLPRYWAANVALLLLSFSQPAWSPFPCQHKFKHDRI
jgi:hypothetical protein